MANTSQDVLSAFLTAEIKVEKPVSIPRLGVELIVKALDGKTIGKINEQSTHYVVRGSKREPQLDEQKFGGLLIASACTNISFGDPQMLERYSASDAGDCVQKALLAGEMAKLTKEIMKISGFEDFNDQIEEAKN
ncbi:phage tail assembly chaperone [Cytobacillus oceanisediminis]|uniref:XkdN-like protein n=1 Tax=Cytobacillus oceanisediminis 2691 TaxID=1196031 RepID=A0A160MA69_9BACI|nr:hypothetical protein [Cytobacillus oceanisediminis]AND39620.1 hypothetical protein A361_10885 [Cytobacillus oceanisediminis 2691]